MSGPVGAAGGDGRLPEPTLVRTARRSPRRSGVGSRATPRESASSANVARHREWNPYAPGVCSARPKSERGSSERPDRPSRGSSGDLLLLVWTASGSSNKLAKSMKRKNESQLMTVEDFYRRCLQGTKPRLGQVASKRGGRIRRRRRIVGGRKQATLWNRLRSR